MSARDLNIVERGIEGQDWSTQHGKITAKELADVGEQRTNSTSALNALPTPFARFFVVKEAFRRVREEYVSIRSGGKIKEAGDAYHQLVSDCLDVYELLFNLKHHRNNWKGKEIIIREWIYKENIEILKKRVPKLYNSVDTYWGTDVDEGVLYFIILRENGKERLLATSSPWTGFVTPPDMDRTKKKNDSNTPTTTYNASRYEDLYLNKKGKGKYFFESVLFEKRPEDFKNYMFKLFANSDLDDKFDEIRDYIKEFKDDKEIRDNYPICKEPVRTEDDNYVEVNGLQFLSSAERDVTKMFNDVVIKVPYRISEENYFVPRMDGKEDRNYDYILPISKEALSVLDIDNLVVTYKERTNGKYLDVTVKDGDKEYTHTYNDNSQPAEGNGMIVDLAENKFNISFDTALFPNTLSSNEEENNYFKLMIAVRDANKIPTLTSEKIKCVFFARKPDGTCDDLEMTDSINRDQLEFGYKKGVVRSIQDADSPCGTVFFEVFKIVPAAYSIHMNIENKDCCGVFIPKFKKASANKNYTYTIDFGTTNTYISKREQGVSTEPLQMAMNETMMSYLHGISKSSKSLINRWENVPFKESESFFQSEFVPPFIDGKKYKFPLRTAISKTKKENGTPTLFDNRNIAFSYGKKQVVGSNDVTTDIKWTEKADEKRLFIRELLMLVKADALQNDADLSKTEIIWFYPLSFTTELMDRFKKFWKEESQFVLGIPESQIKQYTESESPYYYFAEKDYFKAISSVAVVDIGGGSTDMVYFEQGVPKIANSVHFGCDVMWENGYDKMINSRRNGVYKYYETQVNFSDNEDLDEVNKKMTETGSNFSTRDILNFWISNSDQIKVGDCNFSERLKYDCKPLFLYHYAAIIYYMAKMFKSHDLSCPRAITFSGNGSKYIDQNLTSNVETLTEITMIIFKAIYGNEIQRIQIILPDYRKEATCYGGLYRDKNLLSPQTIIFQGVNKTEYETIEDLKDAFENKGLRNSLIANVKELNGFFVQMLRTLMRLDNIENLDISSVEDKLSADIADSLDKNFHEEVVTRYASTSAYRDSLFFIPVIDNILTLTDVTSYKK